MTDDDEYDVMMRTVTCISLNELWLQPHNIGDTILSHPNTAPADSRNARAAGHPKSYGYQGGQHGDFPRPANQSNVPTNHIESTKHFS